MIHSVTLFILICASVNIMIISVNTSFGASLIVSLNSYQCSCIGIGLLVQEELSYSVVATVSCDVQRGKVVECDIINRRLVLQQ